MKQTHPLLYSPLDRYIYVLREGDMGGRGAYFCITELDSPPEHTHLTWWTILRLHLRLLFLRPGQQERDSVGLQPNHAIGSRTHKTVLFEVFSTNGDVSPARLLQSLSIGFEEKLDPFHPLLWILR